MTVNAAFQNWKDNLRRIHTNLILRERTFGALLRMRSWFGLALFRKHC